MARPFTLPDLGEGIHEGEIMAVRVNQGDSVREGDIILEIETDKALVEIPSPFTGVVTGILVAVGDVVKVGDVLITFDGNGGGASMASPVTPAGLPEEIDEKRNAPVPASPATRRLARELGVSLAQVPASGAAGLVTAEDVRAYAAGKKEPGAEVPAPTAGSVPKSASRTESQPLVSSAPPMPDFSRWGTVRRVPMRSLRRATARRMTLAWAQVPHVNSQDTLDVTKLETFRNTYKDRVARLGGHLTLTVFALKAAATALKRYPNFNATLDTAAEEIILKEYFHIGVAVQTSDGLIVPVIKDVDRKSIMEIAVELTDLVARTRDRKARPEELQGGSFTITNAGALGGGFFAPIINYPEVAILGMGSAQWQPVVRSNAEGEREIVTRLMLPTVLCFDHRVLDGAEAVRFLMTLKEALQDPEALLMTMI